MDIFESLENLNVSEECFDEIMDIVEGLVKVFAPYLAGKSKDGKKESVGTQIDRASVKHPLIYKAASTIDKGFAKRKSTTDSRTPDEKLKNIKPAGTIYGKDMYSSRQLKGAGYKNEASEERFNDIISIIEELISERNQENRQKKKDWETRKVPETSPFYGDSKEFRLKGREATIKGLKKHSKDKGSFLIQDAIDKIAQGSRTDLGREQNPVSFTKPSEWSKDYSKESRKEQSQRGSTKDNMAFDEDDLKTTHSVIKGKLEKKKESMETSEEYLSSVINTIVEILSEGWADILKQNPEKADAINKVYSAESGRYGRMPRKDLRYSRVPSGIDEYGTIPKGIREKGIFVKDEEGNRATKETAGSEATRNRRGKNGGWSYIAQFGKSAKEKKKSIDYDFGGKKEKAYDDIELRNYDSIDNSPQVSNKKLQKTQDRSIERHGAKVVKQLKAKARKR